MQQNIFDLEKYNRHIPDNKHVSNDITNQSNHIKDEKKPNMSFKLQISKDKVEKMQQEKIEEIIKNTQKERNRKRIIILLSIFVGLVFVANFIVSLIFSETTSTIVSIILFLILFGTFSFLVNRNAPTISKEEVLKKINQI